MAKTASLKTRIRAAKPGPGAAEPFPPAPAPRRRLSDDARIVWLIDQNPMTPGKKNYDRFAARLGKPTVGECLKAGSSIGGILYDSDHGYLTVEGYTPPPKATE